MAYSINDNCMGCTLCAKNCPVKAISGALKEKHTIDASRCIECGVCGKLCARGAVVKSDGSAAEKLAKNLWPKPEIDTVQCTGCSMCVENCPEYCLEISGPKFHGDIRTVAIMTAPEKCIGCGICADNCPVEAIKMVKPE